MSMIYDNWEKLVAAVLKREENWEMAHAPSRSISNISSIASDFDPNSSFRQDENFKSEVQESATQIDQLEWIERYEPGVYLTVVAFIDGTKDLKRARFSRKRFNEAAAEKWWHDNREKVYTKYDVPRLLTTRRLARLRQSSISNNPAGREERRSSKDLEELVSLGRNEHPLPETIVDKNMRSASSENQRTVSQIVDQRVEEYEPGVRVKVVAFRDGTRDIRKVVFRRPIFTEDKAEAWWIKNREKVYEKYNVQAVR